MSLGPGVRPAHLLLGPGNPELDKGCPGAAGKSRGRKFWEVELEEMKSAFPLMVSRGRRVGTLGLVTQGVGRRW